MAKSKKKETKKASRPAPKSAQRSEEKAAPVAEEKPRGVVEKALAADATRETAAAPTVERAHDPRLPPVGTVIRKVDRRGAVRCECTIEEGGIRYAGKVYRSLSAAAMAAAKDLGVSNTTANGWNFWGLTKPARRAGDPLGALDRAWERYRARADSAIASAKTNDDVRARVKAAIARQAGALAEITQTL